MDLKQVHLITWGEDREIFGTYLNVLDHIDLKTHCQFDDKNVISCDYKFIPNHRYIILGPDNWRAINLAIHLGPRGEGFFDCSKMKYLRTREDVFFKFIYKNYKKSSMQWLTAEQYKELEDHLIEMESSMRGFELRSGVSKKSGKNWYGFVYDVIEEPGNEVRDFIYRDDFVLDYPKLGYYKIIRSTEDIDNTFNYFMNKTRDDGKPVRFGLDYETR